MITEDRGSGDAEFDQGSCHATYAEMATWKTFSPMRFQLIA